MKQTSSSISEESLLGVKKIAERELWSVAKTIGYLVDCALREKNRKKKKNEKV